MTLKEIEELAGHRTVSPWIVKLVGDAVAKEREACAKACENSVEYAGDTLAEIIRARGKTQPQTQPQTQE